MSSDFRHFRAAARSQQQQQQQQRVGGGGAQTLGAFMASGAPGGAEGPGGGLRHDHEPGAPTNDGVLPLLARARASGSLNASNKGLGPELPHQICHLHDQDMIPEGERFWDNVDLTRLDVSMNDIHTIPADISMLEQLERFTARNNKIATLPDAFYGLRQMTYIDLCGNGLAELSPRVGMLDSLQELKLSHNQLTALPDTVSSLRRLRTLDVSHNRLTALPEAIGGCGDLQTLDVSHNALRALPEGLGNLSKLATLYAFKNGIERVPAGVQGLRAISVLDLRDNRISQVSALPVSPKLGKLLLSFNQLAHAATNGLNTALEALVSDQAAVNSLCEVHLGNNGMTELPPALGACRGLTTLDVAHNELSDLPCELGYLPKLQRLSVEGNRIRRIRRQLIEGPPSELKTYLRTRGPPHPALHDIATEDQDRAPASGVAATGLDMLLRDAGASGELSLKDRNLGVVPADLLSQSRATDALTILDLSGNGLSALPEALGECARALTDLCVDRNALTALPRSLLGLRLQRLSANVNCLTANGLWDAEMALQGEGGFPALPPICASLKQLHLTRNLLTSVPRLVFCANSLDTLILEANRLTRLNGDVRSWSNLQSLHTLNLASNKIETLGNFPEAGLLDPNPLALLRALDLSNNNLRQIAPELGFYTNLNSLQLHGNPQKNVRTTTISRGTGAVLEFLQSRVAQPTRTTPSTTATNNLQQSQQQQQQQLLQPPLLQQRNIEPQAHGWQQQMKHEEELRVDVADGNYYTMQDFIDEYGGLAEWHAAAASSTLAQQPAAQEPAQLRPHRAPEPGPGPELLPPTPVSGPPPPFSSSSDSALLLQQLHGEIASLEGELESLSLSQAKRYSLKKQLAMKKAQRIKEERKAAAKALEG